MDKKSNYKQSEDNEAKLLTEGILMYPEMLDLKEESIAKIAKEGYVVVIGNRSFVLTIPE